MSGEGHQNLYNAINAISQQISAIIGTLGGSGSSGAPGLPLVLMTPVSVNCTTRTISSVAATYVMAGMGSSCTLTRISSGWATGRFRIDFQAYWSNDTKNDGMTGRIYCGTGTAPSSGAGVPAGATQLGNQWYDNINWTSSGNTDMFSRSAILLSSGAPSYWFDIAINLDGGGVTLSLPQFLAQEI